MTSTRGVGRLLTLVLALILAPALVPSAPSAQASVAPAAPTGLTVTMIGSDAVAQWAAVTGATGYEVTAYDAVTAGATRGTCSATAPATTCTIASLSAGPTSFFTVRALNGATEGSDASPRIGLCNGASALCSRPFNQTVFAGTHNSMASDDAWGPISSLNPITTQKYTIREQLNRGIRALSFDVWYGRDVFFDVWNADGPTRSGVEPYLCHSYCSLGATSLEDGFQDVRDFLAANPREVVVIYFEDYVSVEDTAAVVTSSGLAPYVFNWSGTAQPYTSTLEDMIAAGTRAVLVSQNVSTVNQTQWYPRLTSIGMDTDYDFSTTAQLTEAANLPVSCDPTPWGRRGNGRFFVMQHFITNVIASKANSAVVNARDVLVQRALACKERRGVMPSVLLVDYFELPEGLPGVLDATRHLNGLYDAAAPTITSVSPTSGATGGGTTITITGTNLDGATAVTVGGIAATSVTAVNATTVTAVTPAGAAGRANVSITATRGSAMLWSGFTYEAGPEPSPTDPSVAGASPSSGSTEGGTSITIIGSNLNDVTAVVVGGAPATSVTRVSDSMVTAVTPAGIAGPATISIRTALGTQQSWAGFTYVTPATPQPEPAPAPPSVGAGVTGPSEQPAAIDAGSASSPVIAQRPTPAQIVAMSPQQIAALSGSDIAALPVSFIRVLTPAQVGALRPLVIRSLSAEQIAALRPAAIAALLPRQVAALQPDQVRSLAGSSLRKLSPASLRRMPAATFRALTPQQMVALLPRQVRVLRADMLAGLSPKQRAALARTP
jgi:IPT/TIG domain